jgi:hypothetical protein
MEGVLSNLGIGRCIKLEGVFFKFRNQEGVLNNVNLLNYFHYT